MGFTLSGIYIACLVFFFLFSIMLINSFFIVKENSAAIIERFGKFQYIANPGINFKNPLDTIAGILNFMVHHHDVKLQTKTNDNVFVDIHCSIQYRVIKTQAFQAFYLLSDSTSQLEAYVFDSIRGLVPKRTLDELFSGKDIIAKEVKDSLDDVMHNYGFEILQTLITHIDPDFKVKEAMNEINAAERKRIATNHKAEAEKLLVIKAAEAQKESKILQGEGIAGQRMAIITGLKRSFEAFKAGLDNDAHSTISENDIMQFLLQIQYYDTLKDIGGHSKTNAIFLNHQNANGLPANKKDQLTAFLESFMAADAAGKIKN